jgi:hypothetical protein
MAQPPVVAPAVVPEETRSLLTLSPTSVVPCFLIRIENPAEVSFDKPTGTFVGEASTMQWSGGTVALKSRKTGAIRFFDNAVPTRKEGDTLFWDLRSSDGFTLRIYNT